MEISVCFLEIAETIPGFRCSTHSANVLTTRKSCIVILEVEASNGNSLWFVTYLNYIQQHLV